MLCIYHIADHDGKGSAGIVKHLYPDCELLGYNHDHEVPKEQIEKHDRVVICDIALPVDYMLELNKKLELVWIDHHASVINEYDAKIKAGQQPIKGIRRVGTAAIELTWEYFHPREKVPEGIKLLALNDLYDLSDPRVRPFEYAIQSLGVNRPEEGIWRNLIEGKIKIDDMVAKGHAILSWIKIRNYRLVKAMVFESHFNGMNCLCANMAQGYSEFFDSVENLNKYDFMVNFYMDKKNAWKMSFYTLKNDVDVSKIAAFFGGGGHVKASGATSATLPAFLNKKV